MPTNARSKLDILICELLTAQDSNIMLDRCLLGKPKSLAAIPLRYRLIMLGFVKGMTLDEVNQKLLENGCQKLYARNFHEATLIYAFSKGLDYDAWRALQEDCRRMREETAGALQEADSVSDSASDSASGFVTLRDISRYVSDNSVQEQSVAHTIHRTQVLEKEILGLTADQRDFRLFLLSNIHSFSAAREKTRYYFCKYLEYFLRTREENYLRELEKGRWKGAALEDLGVFRATKKLSRKKHTPEEARRILEESAVSPGGIYGAFSAFFFDYITADWSEILLEIYYDPEDMPKETMHRLAEAIRGSEDYKNRKVPAGDLEVINWKLDRIEQEEEACDAQIGKDAYQKGRVGNNFITNVLQGDVDLDRTTFIAFLLFYGASGKVPAEHKIDGNRLDAILKECGFPELDPDEAFDDFALRFLEAEDPMDLIQEEAEILAEKGENFYLYKTYNTSKSASRKWEELL